MKLKICVYKNTERVRELISEEIKKIDIEKDKGFDIFIVRDIYTDNISVIKSNWMKLKNSWSCDVMAKIKIGGLA